MRGLICCLLMLGTRAAMNPPTVTLTAGPIVGRAINNNNNSLLAFQGIPYVAPPTGINRYSIPQTPLSWTQPLNTTKYSQICPQSLNKTSWIGNEDCLYLNVFTKNVSTTQRWPVFVWIHGGGFTTGSGTRFSPATINHQFVSKGIVFVSINYRLNALGFISTKTQVVSPNLGMLDQVAALKWIQTEISKFGGDPTRVTIAGESAGSASVSYHLRSPLSQGTFHQAVMESGSIYQPWAMSPHNAESFVIAFGLNCKQQWVSPQEQGLKKCLQSAKLADIMNLVVSSKIPLKWAPTPHGTFMPQLPSQLPVDKSINILMGSNKDEWAFDAFVIKAYPSAINKYTAAYFDQQMNNVVNNMRYGPNYKVVQDLIRHKYTGHPGFNSNSPVSWYKATTDATSDTVINAGVVHEALGLVTNNNTVYTYSFDYASPGFWGNDTLTAVPHFMDVIYLFPGVGGVLTYDYSFDATDLKVSNILGNYWANFVINGVPSDSISGVPWSAMNATNSYLSITDKPANKQYFRTDVNAFWNVLIPQVLKDIPTPAACPTPSSASNGISSGTPNGTSNGTSSGVTTAISSNSSVTTSTPQSLTTSDARRVIANSFAMILLTGVITSFR